MKTLILGIALSTIFFVTCNNDGTSQYSSATETADTKSKETIVANDSSIKGIVAIYLEMKQQGWQLAERNERSPKPLFRTSDGNLWFGHRRT